MGDGADFLGGGGAGRCKKEDGHEEMGEEGNTHRGLGGGLGRDLLGWEIGRGLYGAHLVPYVAVAFLIEFDNVHDSLGVLLLFRSRDAALLEQLLPLLGKTGEFAGGGIEADVGEVHWIIGSADLWALRGTEKFGHEAQHALFRLGGDGAAAESGARGGDGGREGIGGGERGEGVVGGKGQIERGGEGSGDGEAPGGGGGGGGEEVVEGRGVGAGGAEGRRDHGGGCKRVVVGTGGGWR